MRTAIARVHRTALALAVLGGTTAAQAEDYFQGTRSDQLVERAHGAQLVISRGHAELVVERRFFNGGERHDQALLDLFLPPGAVATGLKTLGTLDGRPHWFTGDLLEAEAAAERYRELTGIGGYYPKDPALLSWRDLGHLKLQVFPCPPQADKSVGYTLLLPTRYENGRHLLELPRLGTATLPATVTVRPAQPKDRLLLDDAPVVAGTRVVLDAPHTFALVPFAPEPVAGELALTETGHGNAVSRFHLDVAPRLSEVPQAAHVVIALDTSRSMGHDRVAAELAAARAYVAQFTTGAFEIIEFDRRPRPRFGRFVSREEALTALSGHKVALGNGSNVDAALARADELLAAQTGPTRIVLMTDGHTRSSLEVADLAASLGRGQPIVHLAELDSGAPALSRDDAHEWAAVARHTGGLYWHAAAAPELESAEEMRRIYEEWARPLRIDHAKLTAQGVGDPLGIPEVLEEGVGLEHLAIGGPIGWVELNGELWSQPFRKVLRPDAEESKRWAALVFGQSAYTELTEPEMMTLAERGGAVSPVTSYLAIEPGVRPSTEGLEELELSGLGEGGGGTGEGIGLGSIGTFGHGRGGLTWDPVAVLTALLAPAWNHCGGPPGTAKVVVETTYDEIVDVPTVTLDTQDVALRACLLEATWSLALDQRFTAFSFRSFELEV